MGIGELFGAFNQGMQQITPQQRAMLLRMAAANVRSPIAAQGLAQQADDYIRISENAKRQALAKQELDQRKEYDKFRMDVYRDEINAKREDERKALESQQTYTNEMRKILTTPQENWPDLATTITHPKALEFMGKPLSKGPLVEVNTGLNKPPANYMWKDPNNPAAGVDPIPGGPAEKTNVGDAGKEQMLEVARSATPNINRMLFNPDGSINRKNLAASSFGGIPYTQGKTLANQFELGIQAITRLETGAAMPAEELENTRARFQPGPLDSDELIRIKYQMYQDFINGSLKLVQKSKGGDVVFDEALYNAELQKRLGDGGWSIVR